MRKTKIIKGENVLKCIACGERLSSHEPLEPNALSINEKRVGVHCESCGAKYILACKDIPYKLERFPSTEMWEMELKDGKIYHRGFYG